MQEIKAEVKDITNLEVKSKVVEDDKGDRQIVTMVKFDCHTSPKAFDMALLALTNRHQLDVVISSPQLVIEGMSTEDIEKLSKKE